jgi:hypothetical protein
MHVHGKTAGAYCGRVARHQLLSAFAIILGFLWMSGALFGFWLAAWNVPLAGVATLVAIVSLYLSWGAITRAVDDKEKRFRTHARGLEGEQLVGSLLDELGDEWHVFHGFQLTNQADYDILSLVPAGCSTYRPRTGSAS